LEFLNEYAVFLAKVVTFVIAILVVAGSLIGMGMKKNKQPHGAIEVTHLNDEINSMADALRSVTEGKQAQKQQHKDKKKQLKAKAKEEKKKSKSKEAQEDDVKKHIYVLDFDGDIKASGVDNMREEITSILSIINPERDEVVITLSSGGGMVHAYGLASSQIKRITDKGVHLTICVDKVAASGGYMMACVADKILAAPFAVLGSIGVIAQLPNFHRLLKKNDIDYETLTAGEFKRTLTMFGENTDKGREKFTEELEDTHLLFKEFVKENRPQLDIESIATGEVWFGQRALEKNLVDELKTSDEYLMDACKEAEVYLVAYEYKKTLQERFSIGLHSTLDKLILTWWSRLQSSRFYS
jgi:serine protease SohB